MLGAPVFFVTSSPVVSVKPRPTSAPQLKKKAIEKNVDDGEKASAAGNEQETGGVETERGFFSRSNKPLFPPERVQGGSAAIQQRGKPNTTAPLQQQPNDIIGWDETKINNANNNNNNNANNNNNQPLTTPKAASKTNNNNNSSSSILYPYPPAPSQTHSISTETPRTATKVLPEMVLKSPKQVNVGSSSESIIDSLTKRRPDSGNNFFAGGVLRKQRSGGGGSRYADGNGGSNGEEDNDFGVVGITQKPDERVPLQQHPPVLCQQAVPPAFPKPKNKGATPRASMSLVLMPTSDEEREKQELDRTVKKVLANSGLFDNDRPKSAVRQIKSAKGVRTFEFKGVTIDAVVATTQEVNSGRKTYRGGWGRNSQQQNTGDDAHERKGMGKGLGNGGVAVTSAQIAAMVNYNAISEIINSGVKRVAKPVYSSAQMVNPSATAPSTATPNHKPRMYSGEERPQTDPTGMKPKHIMSRAEKPEDLLDDSMYNNNHFVSTFGTPRGSFKSLSPRKPVSAEFVMKNGSKQQQQQGFAYNITTPPHDENLMVISSRQRGRLMKGISAEARSRYVPPAVATPDTIISHSNNNNNYNNNNNNNNNYNNNNNANNNVRPKTMEDNMNQGNGKYNRSEESNVINRRPNTEAAGRSRYDSKPSLSHEDGIFTSPTSLLNPPANPSMQNLKDKAPSSAQYLQENNISLIDTLPKSRGGPRKQQEDPIIQVEREMLQKSVSEGIADTVSPDLYRLGVREPKNFVPYNDEPLPTMIDLWAPQTSMFPSAKTSQSKPVAKSVVKKQDVAEPPNTNSIAPPPPPSSNNNTIVRTTSIKEVPQIYDDNSVDGDHHHHHQQQQQHHEANEDNKPEEEAEDEMLMDQKKEILRLQQALDAAWNALKDTGEQRDLLAFHVALLEGKTNILNERGNASNQMGSPTAKNKVSPPFAFENILKIKVDDDATWGAASTQSEAKAAIKAQDIVQKNVGNCSIHDLRKDRERLDKMMDDVANTERALIRKKEEMEASVGELMKKRDVIEEQSRILEQQKRDMKRIVEEVNNDRAATAHVHGSEISINSLISELKALTKENMDLKSKLSTSISKQKDAEKSMKKLEETKSELEHRLSSIQAAAIVRLSADVDEMEVTNDDNSHRHNGLEKRPSVGEVISDSEIRTQLSKEYAEALARDSMNNNNNNDNDSNNNNGSSSSSALTTAGIVINKTLNINRNINNIKKPEYNNNSSDDDDDFDDEDDDSYVKSDIPAPPWKSKR